jgi:diguanylate cyclase (GGDEF)-like protein
VTPDRDPRLDQLVETVIALAAGRLDTRLEPSGAGDEIDAITVGLNMLAEELQGTHREFERRVQERTLALEAATDELQRLVLHDPLTDLPNRRLLNDRIEHALVTNRRHQGRLAVMFVDVDRFKTVNDSLGHSAGDQLLIHVARQLRRCLKPGDTVARLGGDEFVLLCEDVAGRDEARRIADRVLTVLAEPFLIAGDPVVVTASIGVALSTGGDEVPATLLRQADAAMYAAKQLGRARVALFDEHTPVPIDLRLPRQDDRPVHVC